MSSFIAIGLAVCEKTLKGFYELDVAPTSTTSTGIFTIICLNNAPCHTNISPLRLLVSEIFFQLFLIVSHSV